MSVELEAMESRSRELLSTAGTVLPGACLGQNALPPELSFVVDHGEGVPPRRRARPDLPRLRPRLGPPAPRTRPPRGRPGGAGAGRAGIDLPLALRAVHPAGRDGRRRRALRRAAALPLHRDRGHHVRLPHGARLHPAREGPEVRGRVARVPRLLHGRELAGAVRGPLPASGPRPRRHPPGRRGQRAGGAVQRPRDDRAHRHRVARAIWPRSSSSRSSAPSARSPASSPASGTSPSAWARSSSSTRW